MSDFYRQALLNQKNYLCSIVTAYCLKGKCNKAQDNFILLVCDLLPILNHNRDLNHLGNECKLKVLCSYCVLCISHFLCYEFLSKRQLSIWHVIEINLKPSKILIVGECIVSLLSEYMAATKSPAVVSSRTSKDTGQCNKKQGKEPGTRHLYLCRFTRYLSLPWNLARPFDLFVWVYCVCLFLVISTLMTLEVQVSFKWMQYSCLSPWWTLFILWWRQPETCHTVYSSFCVVRVNTCSLGGTVC